MTPEELAAEQLARYLQRESTSEDMADLLIPPAAVDLRSIPQSEWKDHVQRPVLLPQDIRAFVEGQKEFTREELDRLEDRIAAFYGITDPFYVTCEAKPTFEAWLGKES